MRIENTISIRFTILDCSFSGGTGISFGLISGTVNWSMLDPFPDSRKYWNTHFMYSAYTPVAGTIVNNRIIGTKGSFLTQANPIVPRAEIVKLFSVTLGKSVYPYRPLFSMPFE